MLSYVFVGKIGVIMNGCRNFNVLSTGDAPLIYP